MRSPPAFEGKPRPGGPESHISPPPEGRGFGRRRRRAPLSVHVDRLRRRASERRGGVARAAPPRGCRSRSRVGILDAIVGGPPGSLAGALRRTKAWLRCVSRALRMERFTRLEEPRAARTSKGALGPGPYEPSLSRRRTFAWTSARSASSRSNVRGDARAEAAAKGEGSICSRSASTRAALTALNAALPRPSAGRRGGTSSGVTSNRGRAAPRRNAIPAPERRVRQLTRALASPSPERALARS